MPPPLPARFRLSNKRQLPDDAAAALSLVLPAAAATAAAAAAAAGVSSRQQPEQPSRQVSLDAVAGLLQLPQVQQGGEVPSQRGTPGSPHRRHEQQIEQQPEQPGAKRAKKTGGGSVPARGGLLLPVPLPQAGWLSRGALNQPGSSSPRQLASHMLHLPPLLPSPRRGQAQLQPVLPPPLLPGAASPASAPAPAHSPGLLGSSSPLRGTGSGAAPLGGHFLTGLAEAVVEARQGTPGLGGAEGSSGGASAEALRQQMLLALLQALPEEQQRGLPDEVVVAPLPTAPSTPAGHGSDDQPSPAWDASVYAGLPPSPGRSPALPQQPQPPASQPPSPTTAAGPAAAAQAAAGRTDAAYVHSMWAAAAALPMPPMPPPPPSVAEAAAAAQAGAQLAPEQRQAMFEHSGGFVVPVGRPSVACL